MAGEIDNQVIAYGTDVSLVREHDKLAAIEDEEESFWRGRK